jgi:hypothetical protein
MFPRTYISVPLSAGNRGLPVERKDEEIRGPRGRGRNTGCSVAAATPAATSTTTATTATTLSAGHCDVLRSIDGEGDRRSHLPCAQIKFENFFAIVRAVG